MSMSTDPAVAKLWGRDARIGNYHWCQ